MLSLSTAPNDFLVTHRVSWLSDKGERCRLARPHLRRWLVRCPLHLGSLPSLPLGETKTNQTVITFPATIYTKVIRNKGLYSYVALDENYRWTPLSNHSSTREVNDHHAKVHITSLREASCSKKRFNLFNLENITLLYQCKVQVTKEESISILKMKAILCQNMSIDECHMQIITFAQCVRIFVSMPTDTTIKEISNRRKP